MSSLSRVGYIGDAFGQWYLPYWIHRGAKRLIRLSWNVLRPDVAPPDMKIPPAATGMEDNRAGRGRTRFGAELRFSLTPSRLCASWGCSTSLL